VVLRQRCSRARPPGVPLARRLQLPAIAWLLCAALRQRSLLRAVLHQEVLPLLRAELRPALLPLLLQHLGLCPASTLQYACLR
jgi:hypothetical protein